MTTVILTPVPGDASTVILVTVDTVYLNGDAIDMEAIGATGPVQKNADGIIVEYAMDGALSACQVGAAHSLMFAAYTSVEAENGQLDDPVDPVDPVAEGGAQQ